jgi:predicted permease
MNRSWRRYARFWGARVDEDVNDELTFHIEMRVRDYVARGMSEREARRAAIHRLGNVDEARAACLTIGHRRQRRMTRTQIVDALVQDVRYALRTLARQKGWTAVALVTLALGIGASTAVFSVINSLLLHPLPYAHADRVATLWRQDAKAGIMITPGPSLVRTWRQQSHDLEAVEPYDQTPLTLSEGGSALELSAGFVEPTFFAFTGIPLLAGRTFRSEEDGYQPAPVALLGEGLWRQRFGADRAVIGRRISLDDKPYTVIGIVPAAMRLPGPAPKPIDVWVPLPHDTSGYGRQAAARVRPGISFEQAGAELDSIAARDPRNGGLGSRKFTTKLARPRDFVGFRTSLYLLAGAVALLLIIACANVAHLLIARGAARERELAIRAALGAGRTRLFRQLITESLLLAVIGGTLGIVLGYLSVRALAALQPPQLSELANAQMNETALVAAIVLATLTGLVFGLVAAVPTIRETTRHSLRGAASSGAVALRTHRLRAFLVVTEMALSAMLLVGAVLLVRSVMKLQQVDPGFDTRNLYSVYVEIPNARYGDAAARRQLAEQIVARVSAARGVVAASRALNVPPDLGYLIAPIEGEGTAYKEPSNATATNTVAPEFFHTLGLHLRGRTFSAGSPDRNEIIVNEGLARLFWPGQDAIGKRIRFPIPGRSNPPWMTIIGIAGNVAMSSLKNDPGQPLIYYPFSTDDEPRSVTLALRVRPGDDLMQSLRAAVASIDPRLAPATVKSVSNSMLETIATQRFTMNLLAGFAFLAVALSAIGLYGVIAYVVTQRTREIGVRIALGATPGLVARSILTRAIGLSIVGLCVGLAASVWGTKLIESALYGVTGTDALSFVATALVLLAISFVACMVPMRRAMRVDPVIAMRGD